MRNEINVLAMVGCSVFFGGMAEGYADGGGSGRKCCNAKYLEDFCSKWDYEGSILYNQRYFYRGYERCKRCLQTEHIFHFPIEEHELYVDTFLSIPIQAKAEGGTLSLDFDETRTQFGLRYTITEDWILDANAKYIHYWRDDQNGYDTRDDIWEFGAGIICKYFDAFTPSVFTYYDIRCKAFTAEGKGTYILDLSRWGIPLFRIGAYATGGYVRAKRFFTGKLRNIQKINGMPLEIRNLTSERNHYSYIGGGVELLFCPNEHVESAIGINGNVNSDNKRVSKGNLANYLTNHKSIAWLSARLTVFF
ncbi:MAG: hypothetical protein LBB05_02170 [Puniceicoccales bacterium]|jgi:hypothetical protein|nr:hypothetical protein [Puniceicoccales bacterium]